MLWSIGICQYKVSADQSHVTISRVKLEVIEVKCFFKLTADKLLAYIGSRSHVRLTCCTWGLVVRRLLNANPGSKGQTIHRKPQYKVTELNPDLTRPRSSPLGLA